MGKTESGTEHLMLASNTAAGMLGMSSTVENRGILLVAVGLGMLSGAGLTPEQIREHFELSLSRLPSRT